MFVIPLLLLAWILHKIWRNKPVIAFFHPYTNDGGGGERVLWCAVRAVQETFPGIPCATYTGDEATPASLQARAFDKFGVKLHSAPQVVRLGLRKLVDASTFPHFTLLGQSLGSVLLGFEALVKLKPVLFIDTSGYAFTYPLAKFFGSRVVAYTHYPTINSDMLGRVASRSMMYNNSGVIARSWLLSSGKAVYYKLMAFLYGLGGRCSSLAMVNSSWTQSHIEKLWKGARVVRVYPPCNTEALQEFDLQRTGDQFYFISVAQFRPEKNHDLQLEAFAQVIKQLNTGNLPRFKIVGSCRNDEDSTRLSNLKKLSQKLGIDKQVDFCENVSYKALQGLLGGARAGIHFMVDEHFGISVVEYMAAGAVPIAHDSAGPKQDIVVEEAGERTGFLASTVPELAARMIEVFSMSDEDRLRIAAAARRRSLRFSDSQFDSSFKESIKCFRSSFGS